MCNCRLRWSGEKKQVLRRLFSKRNFPRLGESWLVFSWTWVVSWELQLSVGLNQEKLKGTMWRQQPAQWPCDQVTWCVWGPRGKKWDSGASGSWRGEQGLTMNTERQKPLEGQAHIVKIKTNGSVNLLPDSPRVTLLSFGSNHPALRSHYGAFFVSVWMIHSYRCQFPKYTCLIFLSCHWAVDLSLD